MKRLLGWGCEREVVETATVEHRAGRLGKRLAVEELKRMKDRRLSLPGRRADALLGHVEQPLGAEHALVELRQAVDVLRQDVG